MTRDDPPDWWREEEAADAASDARYEEWLEQQVRDYLAANKRPRGRPTADRKYEIVRFVRGAVSAGTAKAKARALAAQKFGVSKSYVQRLTKKRT
jgi:hypothetical protein